MPRLSGPNILKLGEYWKDLMTRGMPPVQIADKMKKPLQVVHRAIWLGGWPNHLKELVHSNPSIFTRTVLINNFASKQKQCEKNNFALLEREMKRMMGEGRGSKPKLRRLNKRAASVPGTKSNPLHNVEKATEAEIRIKQALSLHNRVAFEQNGSGEVRIFFSNEKDLEFVLERLEDVRYADTTNTLDTEFWSTLEN